MTAMKWWGWGREDVAFDHADKPAFKPFVQRILGVDVDAPGQAPPSFAQLDVPEPRVEDAFLEVLRDAVGDAFVSTGAEDRVVHARGKSLADIIAQRDGRFERLPDVVVRPGDEDACAAVLAAALEADAVVIPFGGGSTIAGSLECSVEEERTIVSVDLARLDRVLEVDPTSRLARIQAGAFGPSIEEQLQAQGFTLGHYPDSFTHSTLGGWVATRSSGMQSDKFGDVADLTRGLRVVTPSGTLVVRPVPSTSTGPSVREMVLGSEGRLGIITEVTVQVHRLAAERRILGYLFPSWDAGLACMRDIAASEADPSVTRVSDATETAFSFATKKGGGLADKLQSLALKTFLRRVKGFPDLEAMCLSFIGFEGSERHVKRNKRLVGKIVAAHGGVGVGAGPGELYDQKKFDTPYIRDYMLDRGVLADVSETAAPWSVLPGLYRHAAGEVHRAIDGLGVPGILMCHLSHSYHGGACLYFTFAIRTSTTAGAPTALEQYRVVKSAVQQAFVDAGGTLSHHHAVGTEHAEWLEQDISAPGVAMVRALLDGTDPGHNLNPGKILTDSDTPASLLR